MSSTKKFYLGISICLFIGIVSYFLGHRFSVIGGPVFAIIIGMILNLIFGEKILELGNNGIKFASKKILQWAVILLGFGLNLNVILETGRQSLPIIISTIATSLLVAALLHKILRTGTNTAVLVGVGSSICGGSAIAATAPVIQAKDQEIAQSISIIFFFNVLAAIVFPLLGTYIGMDTTSGTSFGIFSGTAVNDTSSVTACAASWDSMYNLGSQTLDKAVTVKLTRTLAIIPITLFLAFYNNRKAKKSGESQSNYSLKSVFPFFILLFLLASVITTIATHYGVSVAVFEPVKWLSKFMIIVAMAAIGLNTDIVKLIKTGGKPLLMGACCWLSITAVSLIMQHMMGLY